MKKATHQDTKTHNVRLVLKTIYDHGQISRVDVARITRLTRATVSDLVSELTEAGLVEEIGYGPFARGKPPILLRVVDDARCLIGVDLANSEFRGAVINLRGETKHRVNLPVLNRDGDAALSLTFRLVDELVATARSPILGIGIGTPGLMDARRGVVRNAVNLDWRDLPLGDLLEARYRLPAYVVNDSQVAALAEMAFGDSKDVSNLIVIKVGRGIGAGIVLNRLLYYGDSFGAGEIGHVVMAENGELCRCGQRGCLETLVSSRAIVRKAQAIARSNPQCGLRRFITSVDEITTDVVLEAYENGDTEMKALIAEAGAYLGEAVAYLVSALNVHRIIISGSMARFGEGLIEPIRQQVQQRVLPALASETRIEASRLGNDAVLLGAAALILSRELGIS